MTDSSRRPERIGPDVGRGEAIVVAVAVAWIAAIGGAAFSAIGATIVFELAPLPGGPYEQLLFTARWSRFAAEAAGLLALVLAYRRGRGLPAWPSRSTLLGLMVATALLGAIAARFIVLLGPWLGR